MTKYYESPEAEVIRYKLNCSVFTSGPPDLHDGEEFDPDADSGSAGAKSYFAQD